jgi:cell shape-determining protein MreC
MKKNKLSSYFIFISILTFLAVFFSIVQKSYFNFKKPQKSVENNALLKEINPNLDLSILSTIESKNKNIDENFDFSTIKTANSLTVTPVATSSETLNPETP